MVSLKISTAWISVIKSQQYMKKNFSKAFESVHDAGALWICKCIPRMGRRAIPNNDLLIRGDHNLKGIS